MSSLPKSPIHTFYFPLQSFSYSYNIWSIIILKALILQLKTLVNKRGRLLSLPMLRVKQRRRWSILGLSYTDLRGRQHSWTFWTIHYGLKFTYKTLFWLEIWYFITLPKFIYKPIPNSSGQDRRYHWNMFLKLIRHSLAHSYVVNL
jgi:hypothetical protein